LKTAAAAGTLPISADSKPSDREYWIQTLTRIADPVLSALSQRKLSVLMPVKAPHGNAAERRKYTYLEAFGRLLAGIAPWLESGDSAGREGELRRRYLELTRQSMSAAVDPASPDYMNFHSGSQPVVDAAFFALGILRAPTQLWENVDDTTRRQIVEALRATRVIQPFFNNWLLFSATIEAFLAFAGQEWDAMRIDYALREHEQWYKGDGVYGDGPQFHWDYYNSFVIQPMLLQILETVGSRSGAWKPLQPAMVARAKRYAAIQERLISPEGAFPAIGRSLAYRFGAFHLLSTMALRKELPDGVAPEQVRCALGAVIRRTVEAPGTFDEHGWLRVGFCGHQPAIAEPYISTGSLYLCCAVFTPLGLPSADVFWSGAPQPWTAQKAWNGQDLPADHAI
jgi:hypothetical protein